MTDSKDKSKDKCPKCDSKVHNRKRTKQILTTVATIDYERYMIHCPKCNNTEYPLDKIQTSDDTIIILSNLIV